MTALRVVEQLLNGEPQPVAISQTAQVVSNAFEVGEEDTLNFAFQITVAAVTGTAGTIVVQHSIDGVNYQNADGTNQKVTISAGAGNYALSVGQTNTTYNAKLPMWKFWRFAATTTASDHFTVTSVKVQLVRVTN